MPSSPLQGGSPEVPAYPPELCRVLVYVGTVELSELGVLAVARSAGELFELCRVLVYVGTVELSELCRVLVYVGTDELFDTPCRGGLA